MNRYEKSLAQIFERVKSIDGDIIELGVATGRNTLIFGRLIKNSKSSKHYYGFDTFCGYTKEDLEYSPHLKANQESGRWNNDPKILSDKLKKNKLDDRCHIIKGDIKSTVPNFAKRGSRVSLVYIDCNAYLAAITALRSLQNNLSPGAFICADEHRVGGETKALTEFAQSNNLIITETGDGVGVPRYSVWC